MPIYAWWRKYAPFKIRLPHYIVNYRKRKPNISNSLKPNRSWRTTLSSRLMPCSLIAKNVWACDAHSLLTIPLNIKTYNCNRNTFATSINHSTRKKTITVIRCIRLDRNIIRLPSKKDFGYLLQDAARLKFLLRLLLHQIEQFQCSKLSLMKNCINIWDTLGMLEFGRLLYPYFGTCWRSLTLEQ